MGFNQTIDLPMTSRTSTSRESYSLDRSGWGDVPLTVDARFLENRFKAASLVRRNMFPLGTAGGGSRSWAFEFCGVVATGLKFDDSSVKGSIGERISLVAAREREFRFGADHRPGRGSELLRRRLPWYASSSRLGESVAPALLRSRVAGRCWGCWGCCELLVSKEEADGRR